jgi:hypothetical protein
MLGRGLPKGWVLVAKSSGPSTSHVFSRRVRLFLIATKSFCGDGNRKCGSVLRGRLFFAQVIQNYYGNWVMRMNATSFRLTARSPGDNPGCEER